MITAEVNKTYNTRVKSHDCVIKACHSFEKSTLNLVFYHLKYGTIRYFGSVVDIKSF